MYILLNYQYSYLILQVGNGTIAMDTQGFYNILFYRFQISFDFRTFFANGSVFLLTNANYTEYVAAQIIKGRVVVFWTNNGGKVKQSSSSKVVDDGQWHTATVSKDRRRISLKVDGKTEINKQRITKKLSVTSPLIVGSILDNMMINNDDLVGTNS